MERDIAVREWCLDKSLVLAAHSGQERKEIEELIKDSKRIEKYITEGK